MAIQPVTNIENTKSHKPYREADYTVKTDDLTKPLPPKGHLVHDRVAVMPKYFFKDLAYDVQAVKDGFKGTANDHQTGRLNDVGLKIGGIGIATMLAARTSNPVARIMEYAGLGAFLAAMNLYPKIAIQAPARAMHGFDTGIEYIDDQGRKKSMFQDPNYIPFDMYRGERTSEDLDVIGDRLGIPRNIENRHDVIKEQMRKIGIQTNTLWMLTAGLATPVITALTCCGLEKVIAPVVENIRNSRYDSKIAKALSTTESMPIEIDKIKANKLSESVEKVLTQFKGKELPKEELEKVINLMTENLDEKASEGIREDLKNIFKAEKNGFVLGKEASNDIIATIQNNLPANNKNALEKVFVPTKEELDKIITSEYVNEDGIKNLKKELKKLFANKIAKEPENMREALEMEQNRILENISKSIKAKPSSFVSEGSINSVVDFAKIIGEFKANDKVLDKCKAFKFEYAPETVLARSYGKFEKTLFKVLDIKYKDLKVLKEDMPGAEKLFREKIEALVSDEKKYEKAISELTKVMQNMEEALHGKDDGSAIKDLITAVENNYNNTARRLDSLGGGKFQNTIDRLVKQDVKELSTSLTSIEDLINFLDGTITPDGNLQGIDKVKFNAKGVGSSKNQAITRIVERYQGAENSFRRVLHTLDVFKRGIPAGDYDKAIIEKGRDVLLNADSSMHTMKLGTVNNAEFYKDIMKTIYGDKVDASTEKALKEADESLANRFKKYITRFREIIANNNIDFTKPNHHLDQGSLNKYTKSAQTRMAKFNLVAQSPMDMAKKAAERMYGTQKWLRRVSVIGVSVLGVTLLAQLGFGKLKNPHNLRKQVSDDTNN